MKKSQLKELVKEVVMEYFNEVRLSKLNKQKLHRIPILRNMPKHTPLNFGSSGPKLGTRIRVLFDLKKVKYYSIPYSGVRIKIPAGTEGVVKDIITKFNSFNAKSKHYMIIDPKTQRFMPTPLTPEKLKYLVYFDKYGYISLDRSEFTISK